MKFLNFILGIGGIIFLLTGCSRLRLENVKQSKPGEASGEIVIKP
ncbi:MAG: hypothetical protein ACK4NT_03785 [Candidatus Omnitrophota bacterium]